MSYYNRPFNTSQSNLTSRGYWNLLSGFWFIGEMAIGLMVYREFYFRAFDLSGILQSGFWFNGEFVIGLLVYRGFGYRAFDLSGFCYRANGHRAFGYRPYVVLPTSLCPVIDLWWNHRGLDLYFINLFCNYQWFVPELSTGRMDPRVGSGRVGSGRVGWVTILPDFGGSGRVSTSNLLVFYWLFLGTWIDMNFRILH